MLDPHRLIGADGVPRALKINVRRASELASSYGLKHCGNEGEVTRFLPLSRVAGQTSALTYLSVSRFASALEGCQGLVVVTTEELRGLVPAGNTLLLTEARPNEVFYTILADAVDQDEFEVLTEHVSKTARVSPSAYIGEHVYIDD